PTTPTSFSLSVVTSVPHPARHSFPTRRSSDLRLDAVLALEVGNNHAVLRHAEGARQELPGRDDGFLFEVVSKAEVAEHLEERVRSEEHTSELQSRENLVCRLLLEKKKNKKPQQ